VKISLGEIVSKPLKYTKEQMEGFLAYAKENQIGILKMLDHFHINRRTFYMTAHRYGMTTDGVRAAESFNTRAMSNEQVQQILKTAEAKRISHKKACAEFGYSYNTFRGAIVRLKVKAERFSSTYSKEDVQNALDYAKANHLSLAKACAHLNLKYHLLSPSAKRYGLKIQKNEEIFDEAKGLSDKEFVQFYVSKGYVANEIFHVLKKMGRKISRGMIYYYCEEQSQERINAKIDKLNERLASLKGSQKVEA
jgi:hypothetical protein